MYQKLQCVDHKDHQFYTEEKDSSTYTCPRCSAAVRRLARVLKHRPMSSGNLKERVELPHIASASLNRPVRSAMLKEHELRQKAQRKAEQEYKRAQISNDPLYAWNAAENPDFDELEAFELGDDGLLYVPGSAFKPSMRYTASDGQSFDDGQRNLKAVAVDPACLKVVTDSVRNSALRLNANTVMGQSAHAASGRGVAHVKGAAFRGDHEEWNHLIADCLGGATEKRNLVAASAACNSYMLSIESCLRGKGHVSLTVKAHCSEEDVAEWIEYQITNKGKTLVKYIDARNHYFTREDGAALRKEVLRFARER